MLYCGRTLTMNNKKELLTNFSGGNPVGKYSLVRRRRRWKDNVKFHIRELGWGKCKVMELQKDTVLQRTLLNLHVLSPNC